MNDLNALLDRAAGPATAPVDTRADLTRGHRALARTRRRRGALGLAGVSALGVVGFGLTRVAADEQGPQRAVETAPDAVAEGAFLAQPLEAGAYTFPTTPKGWEVQGSYPAGVTIAPVGFADREPLSFVGKLVIMFDLNKPTGEQVDVDGRTLWVRENAEGYTTIATTTRPGEPEGTVSIQYPTATGWTREEMLAFLAGVTVGPEAQPAQG